MPDTTPAPVNPSPKARFLASKPYIEAHRALIDRPETQRALDYAMLEYQRVLCEQRGDGSVAAANFFKIAGASEFLHVFKNLSEVPRTVSVVPTGNLEHAN